MNATDVERFLNGEEGSVEVTFEEQCARKLGMSGVPLYIINKAIAFSGAQSPETFLESFRSSQTPANEGSWINTDDNADGCGPEGCKVSP